MIQGSRRGAMGAFGAAMALTLSLAGTGLAQEETPALTSDITSYPNYGDGVDCDAGTFNGSPYAGNLKSIDAPDPQTVVFTFCNPDVSFLAQIAFASMGIDDADYLIEHMADGSILRMANGTAPYKMDAWEPGNRIIYSAFDSYWGEPAATPNLELRWSLESAQRLTELLAGTVDGIDNPGPDDFATIENTDGLTLIPREGLNILYLGMNRNYEPWGDVRVRQAIAKGIDLQRIVDNFYPPGSDVAKYFTPCSFPAACGGDPWYDFDPEGGRALLAEAGYPDGFQTKVQLRADVRPYLPDPPVIAQEIQAQLKQNLNIDAVVDIQDSQTYLDANQNGTLDGLYMNGWGADYPDTSNFLDYHFGPGIGNKFGGAIPELVDVIRAAGQTSDQGERERLYTEANNIIREQVPASFGIKGGNGTAWKADVAGAYSSPFTAELLFTMMAGDRDTFVFMQNGEPESVYCGDETNGETLRACDQVKESLYSYELGGKLGAVPALATECTSNDELTVWTCALRDGVKFHNGADFDASDVIVSFAAQWDAASPQHIGRTGVFGYWPSMIGGGYLNPPPPAE